MMILLGMLFGAVATTYLLEQPWRWYWKVATWIAAVFVFALACSIIEAWMRTP